MAEKAKAGELREVDDRSDKKRRRWDIETSKTDTNGASVHALGAGSATPSAATPGGGPRKRLAIDPSDVRLYFYSLLIYPL